MNKIVVDITASSDGKLLRISSPMSGRPISTQRDDNVQQFVFNRPAELAEDTLNLIFAAGGALFEDTPDENNEYILTPPITQYSEFSLYIVLTRNGTRTERSNELQFFGRPFPVDEPVPPVPPRTYMTTKANKITYIRQTDEGEVVGYSELVGAEIPLGSGGGSSDFLWYPAVENGVITWRRSSTTTAPAPVDITGPPGADGLPGTDGPPGADGAPGKDGIDGADGKSAYEIAVERGFEGTEAEWLASLIGPPGADGQDGAQGPPGTDGTDGKDGTDGQDGRPGQDGAPGLDGADGAPGADGKNATINGLNVLNIVNGENTTVHIEGDTLSINAIGGAAVDEQRIIDIETEIMEIQGNIGNIADALVILGGGQSG